MLSMEEYIEYVKKKHDGQTRKQGTPYYLHPLEVCKILKASGFSIEYQIVALFHDLLEDTETTYDEIKKISSEKIADAVILLTKEKNYNMQDYIDRIKKNEIAKIVKIADRLHNILETHLASREFQEKYIKETEDWYINLAKDTVLEYKLKYELNKLKKEFKMNYRFYLILEKRLFCCIDRKTYEYVNGDWIIANSNEVNDRLIGYDSSEPSDSPYRIGNSYMMSTIKEISQEQIIEKFGEDVFNKLKDKTF